MVFTCQCCGDCCSTMGEIISILGEAGPGRFRIGYTTGEERMVQLDAGREQLFAARHEGLRRTGACPFLCEHRSGRQICTVHASRPELCRGYICCRILVLDRNGKRVGRVLPGTRFFTTTDPDLLDLWNKNLKGRVIPDEQEWELMIDGTLTRAGYCVIR